LVSANSRSEGDNPAHLLNRSLDEHPVGREILITSPAYFSLTKTAEDASDAAGMAAATVARAKAEMAMNCMLAVAFSVELVGIYVS